MSVSVVWTRDKNIAINLTNCIIMGIIELGVEGILLLEYTVKPLSCAIDWKSIMLHAFHTK